jgi:hypothetical protein
MTPGQSNRGRWVRSLRLLLETDGETVRLISKQPVNMVPPPMPVIPDDTHVGYWAELRTRSGEAIYHHLLSQQMEQGKEVFSPTPERSVQRLTTPRGTRTFTIVVPDTEEARALVIVGPSPVKLGVEGKARKRQAARSEIATFDLSDGPKGEQS